MTPHRSASAATISRPRPDSPSCAGSPATVATTPLAVHVRDSKDTSVPALTLDPAAWSAFVVFAAAG